MYNKNINETLVKKIQKSRRLEKSLRMQLFPGYSSDDIRRWFSRNGINQHFPIEYFSTEIAIVTPKGIMMKIMPCDERKLCVWGGILKDNENLFEGAKRTLLEETGLEIEFSDKNFIEFSEHIHQETNGDILYLYSYRFVLLTYDIPGLVLDYNSKGFEYINKLNHQNFMPKVLPHQKEFIYYLLDTYYG